MDCCTTWHTGSHPSFLFPATRPVGPAREGLRFARRELEDHAAEAVNTPPPAPDPVADPA